MGVFWHVLRTRIHIYHQLVIMKLLIVSILSGKQRRFVGWKEVLVREHKGAVRESKKRVLLRF